MMIVDRHVREPLTAYIIPSCDAHDSEYIARKSAIKNITLLLT